MTDLIMGVCGPGHRLTATEVERIGAALTSSRAAATRAAYGRAWERWVGWCAHRGADAKPAMPALLAAYITEIASTDQSISTIDKAMAAIRAAHLDAGLPDPTSHAGVARVRAGLRRTIGVAPVKQAHPLTTAEVKRIVSEIDSQSLRGARDRALILLGYAAALRRSELVSLTVRDLSVKPAGLIVTIRKSKGDQDAAGQVVGVLRGQHRETDPVAAVVTWLERSGLSAGVPLFCPVAWSDRRPTLRQLDGKQVNRVLASRAHAAGLGDLPISGHSLRAGHATTAAESGVPVDRLARTTRHRNVATLARYVRPAEVLADTSSGALGL